MVRMMATPAAVGLCLLLLLQICHAKPYYHSKRSHAKDDDLDSPFPPPIFEENDDDLFRDAKWMTWNAPKGKAPPPETKVKAPEEKVKIPDVKVKVVDVKPLKSTKEEAVKKPTVLDVKQKEKALTYDDPCRKIYCKYGRTCKVNSMGLGQCVCAGRDFCQGHSKEVCGSDGVVYPSHCELHRMACVQASHIGVDHTGKTCEKFGKSLDSIPVPPNFDYTKVKVSHEDMEKKATPPPEANLRKSAEEKSSEEFMDKEEMLDAENGKEMKEAFNDKAIDLGDENKNSIEGKLNEKSYEDEEAETKKSQEEAEEEKEILSKDEDENTLQLQPLVQVSGGQGDFYETVTKLTVPCTDQEFERLKDNLLQYHCARIGEIECEHQPAKRQFVANIMFNYYDRDGDQQLDGAEMEEIEHRDHLDKLSRFCQLTDLLHFDDPNGDANISLPEFYAAFKVSQVLLDDDLQVFTTRVTMGNSVELKCDIQGAVQIVWKRNGATLEEITTNDIKAFEDGSLYISDLGLHHMGNYTCQDRYTDDVIQTHVLKVQMPPKVRVSPSTQFHTTGASVTLKCHADGVPEPRIEWEMNEAPLSEDLKGEHYVMLHNNATLEIKRATYTKDTGAYKCRAKNIAGTDQDIATVFIENSNVPKYADASEMYEVFVVFHDNGYTVYEPNHCHVEHQVLGTFSGFQLLPDAEPTVPTLCEKDLPCSWGAAVNVRNRFIYITQPKLNRVVVVEIMARSNPIEIIPMDKVPVKLHYIEHLDQVWVLCWNVEEDGGGKTAIVIRQASDAAQHHTVHTQPIGNKFDLIKDYFLPSNNDLKHKFEYGYVTHSQQQGLYKIDLHTMKYVKKIDFRDYQCIPTSLVFVPLGGQVMVHCTTPAGQPIKASRLNLDYVTDSVLDHTELGGEPYLSPDARFLVTVEEDGNTVSVSKLRDDGKLEHVFDEYTNLHISSAAFFPSEQGHGYDFYASSTNKNDVLYINLASGKVEMIEGVGQAMDPADWPWTSHNRAIVSGGVFGQYLMTPSKDSVVVIDGKRRHVQCEWQNVSHGNVIVWVDPMHL